MRHCGAYQKRISLLRQFSACPPGPAFPSLSLRRRYASLPRQRRGRQRGALCHGFLWHWRCQAEGLQPRAKEGGLGSREQQVSHGHGRIHGWPFTWVAQKAQNQKKPDMPSESNASDEVAQVPVRCFPAVFLCYPLQLHLLCLLCLACALV